MKLKVALIGIILLAFFIYIDRFFWLYVFSSYRKISMGIFIDNFVLNPLSLLLFLLLAYAIGSFVVEKLMKITNLSLVEEFIFSVLVGLGMIAFAVLAAGLKGFLSRAGFVLFFAVVFLFLYRRMVKLVQNLWNQRKMVCGSGGDWIGSLAWVDAVSMAILLWLIFHGFINACSPSSHINPNTYHLASPAVYIREGKIFYQRGNIFACFPGNLEMNYLFALLVKGEVLAKLIPWILSIFLMILIVRFGTRFFKDRSLGLLAATVFSSQPVFSIFFGTAMQDSSFTLYIFASLYAFSVWVERHELKLLSLSGVFMGLALGTKYLGLAFAAALLVVLVLFQLFIRRWSAKQLAVFIGFTILFSCPWYVRNYRWTGNPAWPLFYPLFGGKDLTQEMDRALNEQEIQPGRERTLKAWLSLPYRMLVQDGKDFSRHYNRIYLVWPLFLVVCALLFARPKVTIPPWHVWFFLAFAILASVPLYSLPGFWRYFMPVFPGLCLVLAWGAKILSFKIKGLIFGILILMLVPNLSLYHGMELFPALGFSMPTSPLSPRESYLEIKLHYYPICKFINENLPLDVKILMVEERGGGYYLKRSYLPSDPLYQTLIRYQDFKDVQDLLDRLNELGVTHILYNEKDHTVPELWRRNRLPQWYWDGMELIQKVVQRHSRLVKKIGPMSLYEIQ